MTEPSQGRGRVGGFPKGKNGDASSSCSTGLLTWTRKRNPESYLCHKMVHISINLDVADDPSSACESVPPSNNSSTRNFLGYFPDPSSCTIFGWVMLKSNCSSMSNSDKATAEPVRSARIILMITGIARFGFEWEGLWRRPLCDREGEEIVAEVGEYCRDGFCAMLSSSHMAEYISHELDSKRCSTI